MSPKVPHLTPAPSTKIGGSPNSTHSRAVPITFHTDEETALRLTGLAHQAGQEISWYLWRLISDAYIDYVLVNGQEP